MSRMERHKERREGAITNISNEELHQEIEQGYDINPILSQEDEIKRKKSYPNPIIFRDLSVKKVATTETKKKEDLFDIEEVFKELEKNFRAPDYDTQVEIMQELISNKSINHISDLEHPANEKAIYKDEKTNQIYISEDELNNILINKEREYQKELSLKKSWKNRKSNNDKEVNPLIQTKKKDKLKKNVDHLLNDKPTKKFDLMTIILGIVLLVLIVILIMLIITFLK
ncbi:MAG: hypothetical protein LBR40_03405 [Bacilli bacterium]|jgi:hypothetical protein|nr:hypothetical protein [Bacilli bacterium]